MGVKMRKKLTDFLKSKDRFGQPITLKYKNDSVYKSTIGGVMTLISFSLLIMYFVYLSVGTFHRTNFTIFSSLYKKDLNVDNTTLELTIDNFDIALHMMYNGRNQTIKNNFDYKHIFSAYFLSVSYSLITDQKLREELGMAIIYNENIIETEYCKLNRLGDKISQTFDNMETQTKFVCPYEDFKFNFIGSQSTNVRQNLVANVDYCQQDYLDKKYPGKNKTCKSKAESNKIINLISVEIPMLLQYFDEKDFSRNPIKSQLNYEANGQLHPNISMKYSYKISENKVNLKDSWMSSLIDNRELTYIDMKVGALYQNQPDSTTTNPLLQFQFLYDENVVTKDRAVSTILDAFANTGGMMGIVFSVVSLLIGWVQESLFHLSIMKKIFFILEDEDKDNSKKNQNSKCHALKTISLSPDKLNHSQIPSISDLESINSENTWHDQSINKIIKYIRSLKPFAYGFRDICKYKLRRLFQGKKQQSYKDTIYQEGLNKLEEQFDIVKVMKSLRKIDLVAQITLAKYQHQLLPYMKNNVLGNARLQISSLARRKVKTRLYESIKQLVSKSDSSKVDRRLLKNLDVRGTGQKINNDVITDFDNTARDNRLKEDMSNSPKRFNDSNNFHQSVVNAQIKTIQ